MNIKRIFTNPEFESNFNHVRNEIENLKQKFTTHPEFSEDLLASVDFNQLLSEIKFCNQTLQDKNVSTEAANQAVVDRFLETSQFFENYISTHANKLSTQPDKATQEKIVALQNSLLSLKQELGNLNKNLKDLRIGHKVQSIQQDGTRSQ